MTQDKKYLPSFIFSETLPSPSQTTLNLLMGDKKYIFYRKCNKNLIVSLLQFFIHVEKMMILLYALLYLEVK